MDKCYTPFVPLLSWKSLELFFGYTRHKRSDATASDRKSVMNEQMLSQLPKLLDELAESGWALMPHAIADVDSSALAIDLDRYWSAGRFKEAEIGQGLTQTVQKKVRSDKIHWLGDEDPELSIQYWLKEMKDLTIALNENFFLSLSAYDCHFACYDPGDFYHKHRDRFRDKPERILSVILFLNQDWLTSDAGELLIFHSDYPDRVVAEIKPEKGSMVIFQSDKIYHAVRETKRRRLSLTGWLKSNPGL